jgi:uncharacterized SAM-dependent methyltransferase
VDTKKDAGVLNAAYNDRDGVTARFNLNVLKRINRELKADFVLSRFRHNAFYNEETRAHRNAPRKLKEPDRPHRRSRNIF